jgi:hypothetical protein
LCVVDETKNAGEKREWSGGRPVDSCWDVDELEGRREEIEGRDLQKWGMRV